MKPLILGLGNDILRDDGFGIHVIAKLKDAGVGDKADLRASCLAGFSLLDLLRERTRVLIIDAGVLPDLKPGELRMFRDTDLACTAHLYSQHQADLPTILEFGRSLGIPLPDSVDLLVCGAGDVVTLSESLSPEVERTLPEAVAIALQWLEHVAQPLSV